MNDFERSRRTWPALALVTGILVLTATLVVLATAPLMALLGSGAWALPAAIHGVVAFLLMVASTVGLYLGWRLFMGRRTSTVDLQLVAVVMAVLSLLTILTGNWIYIGYRAKTGDSPRAHFLATQPEIHKVFFEFKEFAALFTLPLAVAAAFILWRYGRDILTRNWTRNTVAILLGLHFFYFVVVFGLGAAITKLKGL